MSSQVWVLTTPLGLAGLDMMDGLNLRCLGLVHLSSSVFFNRKTCPNSCVSSHVLSSFMQLRLTPV